MLATVVSAEDPPAPTTPGGGGNSIFMLVMFGVLIIAMVVMSRRNKKKQGDANAFRSELAPGQRVMTMAGLVGVITRVEGDVITVASQSGQESQWIRRAIRSLVPDEEWEAMTAEYPDDDEDGDAEEAEPQTSTDEGGEGDPPEEGTGPGIQRF
jgi:preprotein translocase subunit YajC